MRNRTRSIGAAAVAVVAVFALSACTSGTTPTEAPSATQQAPQDRTAPSGFTADEQAFVDAYELAFYPLPAADEAMLVDLGYEVCTNLDAGFTIEDEITTGVDAGVDPFEVGFIIGAAIEAFCPAYTADAEAFIAANSPAGVTV